MGPGQGWQEGHTHPGPSQPPTAAQRLPERPAGGRCHGRPVTLCPSLPLG